MHRAGSSFLASSIFHSRALYATVAASAFTLTWQYQQYLSDSQHGQQASAAILWAQCADSDPPAPPSSPLLDSLQPQKQGQTGPVTPISMAIRASMMIPGRGPPVSNALVLLGQDGKIAYAGSEEGGSKFRWKEKEVVEVETVMPGLWDCHCHLIGLSRPDLMAACLGNEGTQAARATHDAYRALQAGFTSVRELGGNGLALAPVIAEGTLLGPTIYAAGSILSMTGGHGDLHSLPYECMSGSIKDKYVYVCDGVPEVLRATRRQLRKGADVIKICASGGVLSDLDDPYHQQFSDEELSAIVGEAERADRLVAAHCHGKAGILAALRAGCGTIEHGSFLDEECAALMKEKGAILVPTRFVVDKIIQFGENKLPPEQFAKALLVASNHEKAVKLAIRHGVRIALGTDIITSGENSLVPWGHHGIELQHMVKLGMTPLQAIESATANGPLTLGPRAPKSGQLRAGFDADVLVIHGNPLEDISCLGDPANVLMVFKHGKVVKDIRSSKEQEKIKIGFATGQ